MLAQVLTVINRAMPVSPALIAMKKVNKLRKVRMMKVLSALIPLGFVLEGYARALREWKAEEDEKEQELNDHHVQDVFDIGIFALPLETADLMLERHDREVEEERARANWDFQKILEENLKE